MRFENVRIPFRGYWSTPFSRWQGRLSGEHPLRLLARCGAEVLRERGHDLNGIDGLHLGTTVPSLKSFWGAPWVAAMMGNAAITGPTLSQACATSARVIVSAAATIEAGGAANVLAVAADRTSNGPHIVYPDPAAPGGTCQSENWVLDNFQDDPHARLAMLDTAENMARRFGFSRAAQDAATLLRHRQYADALADDRAFQRRYMHSVHVQVGKHMVELSEDEGVVETTADGLARLRPLQKDGTVTYGAQTHPADGNAGIILQSAEGRDDETGVRIRLIAYGEGRAESGYMGMAPVPAAQAALARAGLSIADIRAIKTHNPFVVNDLYFAQEMGVALEAMNNFGSSLIYGHPQAPTGMRLVIELIEELVLAGGGYGLFTGCAAGDTGAALVVRAD